MDGDLILKPGEGHSQVPRFKVLENTQSMHCCFVATVLDTSQPALMHGEHYRDHRGFLHYYSVCETFTDEDAILIAESLNGAMKGEG